MNRPESNMFAVFLIVAATMIFYILACGLVWLAYGEDGLQTMLLVSGIIGVVVVGVFILIVLQLVFAWINNLQTRNFIAAQQSHAGSHVANLGVIKESLRGERELANHQARSDFYDTQRVHRLADQRAKLLMAPTQQGQSEVDAWYEEEDEDAEYQVLE